MKFLRMIIPMLALLFALKTSVLAQSWQPLTNQPNIGASVPLLLTDGTVIVQDGETADWWRLTPDVFGSYVNGTWTQLPSMPDGYTPLYFASAVLADGRVVVLGGEYNGGSTPTDTNMGAIYDPVANSWSSLAPPPGWDNVGDAECVVLPDGRFMVANIFSTNSAILDPVTLTWTDGGTGKRDRFAEEGWTLLPEGSVLTLDILNAPVCEKYNIATNSWISAGSTFPSIADISNQEIGPAVLRPNGTVFAVGGTNHTAIYTPGASPAAPGSWTPGPSFPPTGGHNNLDIADGPACLLPNGNVLCGASPGLYKAPVYFFEFDGANLNHVPATPNSSFNTSYYGSMIMLPTGQVMYTDFSSDVEIYTPIGGPQNSWRPTITSCPTSVTLGGSYVVEGTQFNGLSQCSSYGDDESNATNYPLVRITNNATGHITYCRTFNHSTMGVATGSTPTSTHFKLPAVMEIGASTLAVVTNGIPSALFTLTVASPVNQTAVNVVPAFQNGLSASNLAFLNGQPTQMAWGPDNRLYVMTASNGVHSFSYDSTTGSMSDEKIAVPNVSGIGIAFHNSEMYLSLSGGTIMKLTDNNLNGKWGETNLGELAVPIVTGIPTGDHAIDQLQVKGDTLFVGIGRRTINGSKGDYTSGSLSDIPGDSGFWSGGHGSTWGDCAYGGTISWIKDLTKVANTPGSANTYTNTTLTQQLIQTNNSPITSTDPGKLTVHSAGTRNPYGLCFDSAGNLWFTCNFNRTRTLGNGTSGFGYFEDSLGPDFSKDVQDQLFKASAGADYGYSDANWRDVNPMMDADAAGYHRVRSTTFDNLFNTGPFVLHNPANPDGLGPSSSSDGCGFFYAPGMPAALQNNIFVTRWNGTITEASPGTHSLTYQDLVAVDPLTGKVKRVATGFVNPLCVLWDGGQNLLIGDYGNGGIYALHVKTSPYLVIWAASGMIGSSAGLQARMTGANSMPIVGRTITFSINGVVVGSTVTDINGYAKYSYLIPASLGTGAKTVTAAFAGDAQYTAASRVGPLTVLSASTVIGLGPITAKAGRLMYAGARLTTNFGISISGRSLDFSIDGTVVGTLVTDNTGSARLYYPLPQETPAGAHSLVVSFAGDSIYNASSRTVTLTVPLSNTSLAVYNKTVFPGQPTSLQCRLFNEVGQVAPNRTVTFSVNGTSVGTINTDSKGFATIGYVVPDSIGAGGKPISVTFAGDTLYNGCTGNGTLTIIKTNSTLNMLGATVTAGQTLRQPVRLLGSFGNFIVGRTISLKVNGISAGTAVTAANGVGGFTYVVPASTAPGTYTMTASFAGDAVYNASTFNTTLTVK